MVIAMIQHLGIDVPIEEVKALDFCATLKAKKEKYSTDLPCLEFEGVFISGTFAIQKLLISHFKIIQDFFPLNYKE